MLSKGLLIDEAFGAEARRIEPLSDVELSDI
jgi:hypothetical protein